MALETEVKIYIPDLKLVQTHLQNLGAVCTKERIFERNLRYDTPNQSLALQGGLLRLRQDTRARITYKGDVPQISDKARTLLELETEVGDFVIMDTILRKLGLEVQLLYEKFRTTYEFAETEIVLDEMPFGNFMEVEGEPAAIENALRQLGLQNARRILSSYVAIFRDVKEALGLTFRDLSFDNFTGINLPPHLFE